MTTRRQILKTSSAAQPQAKQDKAWPAQTLKIIVPFPPGGTSDIIARIIGNALSEALKTTVIVENKTGANGSVGAGVVAASTDSHTMLLSDMGAVALAHVVTPELPYKTTDLQGVTKLAYSPHMLVATPSLPANNLQELIALSKRKKINVASSGSGAPTHLAMAEIAMATGM